MEDAESRARIIDVLVEHFAGTYQGDRERRGRHPREALGSARRRLRRARAGARRRHLHRVATTPQHEPRLTLKIRPTDLRRIVTGDAGPRRLALQGKLRVLGDLRFGMKLQDLFDF